MIICLSLHLQTAGRRLQQAETEATVTIRSTFTGAEAPAATVVEVLETAGCTGIQGLADVLANCTLQRGYTSSDQIKQPGLSLAQQPTPAGERLTFVATFTEDGQPVSRSLPIALTTQPPNALDCTNTQQGGSQVFSCLPTLQLESAVVIATGPNPDDPAQRVTASITTSNISKSTRVLAAPGRPCGYVLPVRGVLAVPVCADIAHLFCEVLLIPWHVFSACLQPASWVVQPRPSQTAARYVTKPPTPQQEPRSAARAQQGAPPKGGALTMRPNAQVRTHQHCEARVELT